MFRPGSRRSAPPAAASPVVALRQQGRWRLLLCLPLLCAVILLQACGDAASRSVITALPPNSQTQAPVRDSSADTGTEAADADDDSPSPVDVSVPLTTVSPVFAGSYADAPGGCYTVTSYSDGSANINYIDYEALTLVQLDTPDMPNGDRYGHIPDAYGDISIVWAGGRLFLFRLGGSQELMQAHGDAGLAAVMRLDAGATNPESILLPAGYTFHLSSALLGDGENLYFLMYDNNDDEPVTVLMQLEMETLAFTELHRLPTGHDYTIKGQWDMGPLLCLSTQLPNASDPEYNTSWELQEFYLMAMGLHTAQMTEIVRWGQGDLNYVQNSTFYYWNEGETALYAMDCNSRENRLLAGGFAPDNREYTYLQNNTYDGMLRIQFTYGRGKRNTYFTIDPVTGAVTQPPVDKLDQAITICLELPDAFLVQYSVKYRPREQVDPTITELRPNDSPTVPIPLYGLLSKEDYWAGHNNVTHISDTIHNL